MSSTWRRLVSTTETTLSTGADLAAIRERKPLVHQITNYVVMNETANATLALGALPVMAHAREEVEEMATIAAALVLNIGTLSPPWVEAMLAAGRAANSAGVPVVLDPVGAGATSYRTETARRILEEVVVAVVRGNAAEVATLAGREAEIRGVESIGAGGDPAGLAREAALALRCVAAVTGPVDYVSDGERVLAIANGHPLLATVEDLAAARVAVAGGAPVVQLRLKGRPTDEVVERGRPFRDLGIMLVVNDDVEAAIRLGADGVHLGRRDPGAERALAAGLLLGLSAAGIEEAEAAERHGATYVGAGPVWATPSKEDADPPIGLGG